MDILIPDSWLREHLKTKATPRQIAEYLSLCSQSVEKTTKKDSDWLYEIEITTNRPDCFSVYGVARELAAILPQFSLQAKLEAIPENKMRMPEVKNSLPLEVKIEKPSLSPRFTALIFDDLTIKPSPKIVQERLKKSGIRALNNVVDISNYLMLELGQPMHTFDYDKIKGAKMILRESAGGEKLTTLDGTTRVLPDGSIIIEDGEARIVDLCGIMGGKNSEVDESTKRVLLFVQTYDPMKIRQTCQKLAFRTEAASRFEKGIDPEGVILAMKKATAMFRKNCGARVASRLIDIYPKPPKPKKVTLTQEKLNRLMGIKVDLSEAKKILDSLGFQSTISQQSSTIISLVPHWRNGDIDIGEDLVEEVARIYGYHHLPSHLPQGQIPQIAKNPLFSWQERVKDMLKYWGFTETYNYSMVGESLLIKVGLNPEEHLKITNPLSEDLVYMRTTLIPSLFEVMAKNQAENEKIRIFELANVYLPTVENKLPEEMPMLTGTINHGGFYDAKGLLEGLFNELAITNVNFSPYRLKKTLYGKLFHPTRTAEIMIKNNSLGVIGEIKPSIISKFGLKGKVIVFDLDFNELVKHITNIKVHAPIPRYPAIIEDLAFVVPKRTLVGEMIDEIKKIRGMIVSVVLLDSYQNTRTFRITYQSFKKTLTDREVERVREKIVKNIGKKFEARLKST